VLCLLLVLHRVWHLLAQQTYIKTHDMG
jgi:hypothetical protein